MDRLGQWIEERCVLTPTAKVQAAFAYRDYRKWADDRGEQPMTQTLFGRKLVERGFSKTKGRTAIYSGIGLIDNSSCAGSRVAGDLQVISSYAIAREEKPGNSPQPAQTRADGPVAPAGDVGSAYRRASRGE